MTQTYLRLPVGKTQRRNLEILLAHMKTLEASRSFSMAYFASKGHTELDPFEMFKSKEPVCGTVACMCGNGPAAGIRPKKTENWHDYAHRAFGAPYWVDKPIVWDWLFDPDWSDIDDTPEGAAWRLEVALTKGIPANYRDQLRRKAPYDRHTMETA